MRLGPERIPAGVVRALNLGCLAARADVATLELAGTGAVTCFQGLLTNDVEKAGDGGFVYGALLTPKGMIVVEGWAARVGNRVSYAVPRAGGGRERVAEIFARSIPPRLAQVHDRTDTAAVLRLAGPRALAVADLAHIPLPPGPGRVIEAVIGEAESLVARPSDLAPFALQILTTPEAAGPIIDRLARAGATPGDPAGLELARVLSGWPSLEGEVDDKTIPQEVRYDEIGGVSYTKGCYTGQETVSRLHFRGHANRHLRGLLFDADPPPAPADAAGGPLVTHDDREVGRVTSLAWLPEGPIGSGRWIGLGVLRREVEPGMTVRAAGHEARVVDLPFALPYIAPA
jgi:tRNA-modifying protein YgfZ